MALSAEDCLYPRWELKAEVFWPAERMTQCIKLAKEALNGGLIPQANAQAVGDGFTGADKDTKARLWVGYLAAKGRLQQMAGLPSSVDARDEGASSYTADQRDKMAALRDDFLARYSALAPDNTVLVSPLIRQSRAVIADFEF